MRGSSSRAEAQGSGARRRRAGLPACALLVFALLPASVAAAFHDGGSAACSGCHTIHNSEDGLPVDPDHPQGNQWILVAETASDVCLACHAEQFGSVLGSDPLAPPPLKGAGNFVFLHEDNLNDGPDGAVDPIPGDAAGHNINAPAYGLSADATHSTSPGGTFRSADLGCTSCHDPHGNDSFRMLNGIGPVQGGTALFTAPAPEGEGIDLLVGEESRTEHSAYRSGVSDWCGNCHGRYHQGPPDPFHHPTDRAFGRRLATQYNFYDGTDDPGGGDPATAYLPEVPFEDSGADVHSTQGAETTSRLHCLSCHRAHATSAPHAGRWDFNVKLLAEDGVVSGSYPIPDPYDSPNQKQLCQKCHSIQDHDDLPFESIETE
ncbi:MAG: hypothetical protein GF346_07235 [Candidatus Eisenbacteria bacterium]|nr:hypothetical protein [Candidatus Latescibacterota bacterium]MBD3302224.1 hypothetical protein [Candidatus Eisenbacteria bacterium]